MTYEHPQRSLTFIIPNTPCPVRLALACYTHEIGHVMNQDVLAIPHRTLYPPVSLLSTASASNAHCLCTANLPVRGRECVYHVQKPGMFVADSSLTSGTSGIFQLQTATPPDHQHLHDTVTKQ